MRPVSATWPRSAASISGLRKIKWWKTFIPALASSKQKATRTTRIGLYAPATIKILRHSFPLLPSWLERSEMERTDAALGDTFDRMQRTFRQVFDDETLELHRNMTAADVEGWDSLNHIDLIVALDREFRIKFTTAEISKLATVGDLLTLVDKKRVTS